MGVEKGHQRRGGAEALWGGRVGKELRENGREIGG